MKLWLRRLAVVSAAISLALVGCGSDGDGGNGEGGADTGEGGTDTGEGGTDTGEGGTDTGEGDTDTGEEGGDDRFVKLTFAIDDSANKSYTAADGLAWKGSFSHDAETNVLQFDGAWGGPFVPLYDDGPVSQGGHEPEGATAGDSIWSVVVDFPVPEADVTLEYGAISGSEMGSDGQWIWTGNNGTVTIAGGASGTINATGLTIKPWGFVDLRLSLDTSKLDPSFDVEIQLIEVKGSSWGWNLVTLTDDDMDGIYDFVLSQHVGKGELRHFGLLNPGDEPEFVFEINSIEYKVGGIPPAEDGGVSAAVWIDDQWVDQQIQYNDKNNTMITVPELTPPGLVAVNFVIDDSANKTYDATDGLAWKGSFNYNATTKELSFDAAWSGPYPMMYDDGPWDQGGNEPAGSVAGDNIWGVTVWVMPGAEDLNFEYGAVRGSTNGSDGEWIWKGSNGSFTVPSGATDPINAAPLTISPHGNVDLRLQIDSTGLHPNFDGVTITSLNVKGSAWGWIEQPCKDDGTMGDASADDGIYTFLLSNNLSKHTGLLNPGDEPEFIFVINGVEYKDGGEAAINGVSAWTDAAEPGNDACVAPTQMCLAETILIKDSNKNSYIVVGGSAVQ